MKSRWNETEAKSWADRGIQGAGEELGLRVYSSRLLGQDDELVLAGGGNTSVKTTRRLLTGDEIEVLCVKGSGWQLGSLEEPGLPALRLEELRRLESLDTLDPISMMRALRATLVDPDSPNPSVETLLHAFLPDKFVDHTHADALMVFGNRKEGIAELEALFGDEVGVLPWQMVGLDLAKSVATWRRAHPEAIGLVLHQHGAFSFGEDARTSYERMISIVDRVEQEIERRCPSPPPLLVSKASLPSEADCRAEAARIFPLLRRAASTEMPDPLHPYRGMLGAFRTSKEILAFASSSEARSLLQDGTLTPDHVLLTKGAYCVAAASEESIDGEAGAFREWYSAYFKGASTDGDCEMLDPAPRVFLIPDVGLFAFGRTGKEALSAIEVADHTIRCKAKAAALSAWEGMRQADLFDVEYYELEQAKLRLGTEPELSRQVALVSGAAGAIGFAVARKLLAHGAHVVLSDLPGERLERAEKILRDEGFDGRVAAVAMNVCDEESVKVGMRDSVLAFGGLDILVSNAGIAHVSKIKDLSLEDWRKVQGVNETGTFLLFRDFIRVLLSQGMGGRMILNASKNVPVPGSDFVAYSASKAGAAQIAKVAAVELAREGILVNMIHADGVFDDDASGISSGLWDTVGPERMKSRGMSKEELREHYKSRNLMGMTVRAEHVAEAVLFFAAAKTPTTGAALTVDGGHVATFYR